MPRSGRLQNFIKEYRGSDRTRKLSFLPPIFILIVELILLIHALSLNHPNMIVVELTTILLVISIIEMIFVSREIHEHYTKSNFDKLLTIKLDDFVTKSKEKNVKKIVSEFLEKYPKYSANRSEIYHTTCQIMQTHEEEKIEEDIEEKLKKYIKLNKKENVDDIVEEFVKKYTKYKKYRAEVYEITCHIKADEKINNIK